MNRRPFQFAIALLWLTLPLVAIQYWCVWDQLPARMATHFNAAGQPNGWMSREVALEFDVGMVAFLIRSCGPSHAAKLTGLLGRFSPSAP